MPLFTVIGLVARPGNFEYPPGASYNLIQAIAFAGGLDLKLEPRYAIVYRMDADGPIVYAAFQLGDPADAAGVQIKPGDIIAVEHTPRTRSREFLQRIFNVQMGAYLPLETQVGCDRRAGFGYAGLFRLSEDGNQTLHQHCLHLC